MEEGKLTQGVWLPISIAHIYQILVYIATAFSKPDARLSVPTLSQALEAFALPAMAEAVRAEQKASDADNMVESLKAIAKRTGGKVEIIRAKK